MIRDPSDGSVKSAPVFKATQQAESEPSVTPACDGADTRCSAGTDASHVAMLKDALRAAREELIKHDQEFHHLTDQKVSRMIFDAILSESPPTEPQSSWRPIETAPKDEFVLVCRRYSEAGKRVDIDIIRDGQWWRSTPFNQPLHWQPLPEASEMTGCSVSRPHHSGDSK